MNYQYTSPNEQLKACVRTVLIMEGFSEADARDLPLFTNGIPLLFCKTEKSDEGNEKITGLFLIGQASADMWVLNERTTIIAYFFKPFAAASLFNISASKLGELPIYLSSWNAHKYTALHTQLLYATSTFRKMEVLDNLLIQQLKENQEVVKIVQYATDRIMNNAGKESIPDLLETLAINERTFQRIFKKYVGITATQYRRICQFEQSFVQLRQKQFSKISEVAYDNGFADQSHFIRSFKEFTQVTPNDYLKKGLKNKKP